MKRIITVVHSVLVGVWLIFSTVLYSVPAITFGLFSRPLGRIVGRAWARHLMFFAGVRLTVEGAEKLQRNGSYVFMSNHASGFDIPILLATLPDNLTFMAKKELFRIPVFGWGMTALGHMPVDRSSARKALKSIERVVERIRSEHLSVLLFPEGTRSSTGELNVFKQGSMALPLKARVPLVPVYLQGTHHINRKNSRLIHPGNVKVMIGEPIALDGPTDLDKREILLRVREAIEAMKARADC